MIRRMWEGIAGAVRESRGLAVGIWWNVALLLGSVAALPFDRREILGLNPWVKPTKFEISVIVFLVTMAMLLRLLDEGRRRLRTWLGWAFGVAMIVENTTIALQSARGVQSHMNYTSLFNGIAFGVMGVFVAVNTVALAAVLWLFFVDRIARPRVEVWGIRLGLGMILAGSLEGVRIVMLNGHTVGARDGGAGLPFLNWSTLHGDLRVAHFFALHALQLLWLAGWWLGRLTLAPRVALALLWTGSLLYGAGVWLLFAEGMAGRPLLALP